MLALLFSWFEVPPETLQIRVPLYFLSLKQMFVCKQKLVINYYHTETELTTKHTQDSISVELNNFENSHNNIPNNMFE